MKLIFNHDNMKTMHHPLFFSNKRRGQMASKPIFFLLPMPWQIRFNPLTVNWLRREARRIERYFANLFFFIKSTIIMFQKKSPPTVPPAEQATGNPTPVPPSPAVLTSRPSNAEEAKIEHKALLGKFNGLETGKLWCYPGLAGSGPCASNPD